MRKWGEASLADWLRATLTLRDASSEGEDVLLEAQWGVESCALCGRTILLGERILRLRIDGRRVALCSLCEESMRAQRFERAA
jgi:hypothetical protein